VIRELLLKAGQISLFNDIYDMLVYDITCWVNTTTTTRYNKFEWMDHLPRVKQPQLRAGPDVLVAELKTQENDKCMVNKKPAHCGHLYFCKALYSNKGAWVFAKASPLHDQSGNIIGSIESIRDITDRKQVEQELLIMNETLEQRVVQEVERNLRHEHLLIQQSRMATMGEMIGNIAHQWRH
jgi:hypothetical protein